jgi:pimeloyl-ACP methyl ester carboxylesterase
MRKRFLAMALSVVAAAPAAAQVQCDLQPFPNLARWQKDAPTCTAGDATCTALPEEIAAVFKPYAVAAAGAYYSEADKASTAPATTAAGKRAARARLFQLESFDGSWQTKDYTDEATSGLGLRAYHKRTGDRLEVVIAFRGTDRPSNLPDLLSNLSWVTQWFRDNDQYKRARFHVARLRKAAEATPGVKRIAYVTTGHSLGGGLARHVARAFPCTAAVAFDSSFVTNELFLAKSLNSQVVLVHEQGDWFGRFAAAGEWFTGLVRGVVGGVRPDKEQRYGIELIRDSADQHRIEPFAVNMARMEVCCAQRQHWASQMPDAKMRSEVRCSAKFENPEALAQAQRFYCERWRRLKLGPGEAFPAGDICDVSSPRRGEQCGLKRFIDQAVRKS